MTRPVFNLNPDRPTPAPLASPAWDALKGVKFPASVRQLVLYAKERGAGNDTLAHIAGLPERSYITSRELGAALGVDDSVAGKENIWSASGSQELENEGLPQKKTTF